MSRPSTIKEHGRSANESLLDPQSKAVLDMIADANPPHFSSLTPDQLRQAHEGFFLPLSLQERDLVGVEERFIPGPDQEVRIWIYRPRTNKDGPLPVMLFYHGGGMMVGSLELYDTICQRLCDRSGIILVAVDYRLAPEHKYPCAHEDAYAALTWVADNASLLGGDPNRLAVGGDSGGGLLAAAMTLLVRDRNGPRITFQTLIYPALGKRREYGSYTEFAKGYFGEPEQLAWFYAQYLASPGQMNDPLVSPILNDDFTDLPPAFILTAGYDILRDEGEHYAELLKDAGVPVELHRYESTFHPFLNAAGVIDAGKQAIDECADKLRSAFA